jgi:K+-sensing histidine kinase KdpD
MQRTGQTHPVSTASHAADLGPAMRRIVGMPLSALRAAIEALRREVEASDPRGLVLEGALEQVLRLARDIDALAEYASPRPLAPLASSVEEILEAARGEVRPERRARVRLARPAQCEPIEVDSPLLSSALARLLECALDGSGEEVLLRARQEGERTQFTIVGAASRCAFECSAPGRCASPREAELSLGLMLARRDLERMGARLEILRGSLGKACARVAVPNRPRIVRESLR